MTNLNRMERLVDQLMLWTIGELCLIPFEEQPFLYSSRRLETGLITRYVMVSWFRSRIG